MEIFIKPTLQTIQEDMGFDDTEEVDEDALLFEQGYDMDVIEVENGETFTIPEGYLGQLSDEDGPFYMPADDIFGSGEEEEIRDDLESGIYKLEGNIIRYVDEADE